MDSKRLVRVALIEDHPLYRYALSEVVERHPELDLVGCYDDAPPACAGISEAAPDVTLVDLDLPSMDGVTLVQALVQSDVAGRIVMLSASRDGAEIYAAMAAGAVGFLSKDLDGAAICAAVLAAARGESVVSRRLQPEIFEHIRAQDREPERVRLTDREATVLAMAARGCSNNEIARQLYVGDTTIKTHLANLYAKLGVSDRAAAVAQAMKRGLIDVAVQVTREAADASK